MGMKLFLKKNAEEWISRVNMTWRMVEKVHGTNFRWGNTLFTVGYNSKWNGAQAKVFYIFKIYAHLCIIYSVHLHPRLKFNRAFVFT